MADENRLYKEVIHPGLCTVCGTCAGVCPRNGIQMVISNPEEDEPEPLFNDRCTNCSICYDYCPGKEIPLADLDRFVFGRERDPLREPLGIYKHCLRGYGKEPLRTNSSSGGITQAVMMYALEQGYIDAAIMAVRCKDYPWRAVPGIITSPGDVTYGVRSAMEAVPVNSLLWEAVIEKGYSRIGIVGLPCQIQALRKIEKEGKLKKIAASIALTAGLFCNSTAYFIGVEHLIKEYGGISSLQDIVGLDWRAGDPAAMMAMTKDGKMRKIASREFSVDFLSKANYRRDRCLMCIDFSAELADISVGDVFVKVDNNPRWATVITRTLKGEEVVNGAFREGFIYVEPHDPKSVPIGGSGWEMSKHASMYRLMERKKHGWPVPDYQYPPGIAIIER